jgi:hypothetical protein
MITRRSGLHLMNKEVLRLAGLLACVALAASRIGLVAHELVAHGGVALACGAHIIDVQMFWFGGGWIRYVLPEPTLAAYLAISMAGIALELVIGGGLWVLAARGTASLGRLLVRGVGIALVVHATWYLATGAFHGFGDGLILYRELGSARVAVAIAAGLLTCVAAYAGARTIFGSLIGTLPGSPRARIAGFIVAALLGAGLHAGLTIGELRIRRDATYARTMQPERDRVIAQELDAWQREQAARGVAPNPDAERAKKRMLQQAHRTFPFVILLALATVLSVIAGAWRSKVVARSISSGLLARAALVALAAIWLVIGIDGLLS